MNEFRAHKIDGPNALLTFNIGELKLWYWGDKLLGVQTADGAYRVGYSYNVNDRERKVLESKQQQVGMHAGWVGKRPMQEVQEIISRAMLREYAKFARERMAGET